MKKLEENIRKNHDLFDDAEPLAGHFERFAHKLDKQENKKSLVVNFSFIWRAAAAVLILVAVSVLYNQINDLNLIKLSQRQELPEELIEAKYYYANLNQERINQLEAITDKNPEIKEVVNIALQEVEAVNINSEELSEKYIQTNDDRVIDAIITNYRVLGDLLDHIIQKVNESR